MARKGDIKTILAVGSKSMGTKRTADNEQVRSSRKRQKTLQGPLAELKPQAQQDQHKHRIQDQFFRFMDLPGELRNRIYKYATDCAYDIFPPIFPKAKPKPRRGRSSDQSTSSDSSITKDPIVPLPYIGLTQACSLLRSEFRPAWLSTNKIPLCALDDYLRIFFPRPNPRASPEVRKRFYNQYNSSGSLRIWTRRDELDDVDITRLLKHIGRFPNYTITFVSQRGIQPTLLTALDALVLNRNATWVKWIKNNTISQVRLIMRGSTQVRPPIRVVVKEPYAPQWMRSILPAAEVAVHSEPYADNLGLTEVQKEWKITFGVDYS